MLDVDGLVFHGDGFFDRDYVHADAGTSWRNHRGDLFKRQERHSLEEHGQFRMFLHEIFVHVGIFARSRDEQRHPIASVFFVIGGAGDWSVFGVLVAIVIFDQA